MSKKQGHLHGLRQRIDLVAAMLTYEGMTTENADAFAHWLPEVDPRESFALVGRGASWFGRLIAHVTNGFSAGWDASVHDEWPDHPADIRPATVLVFTKPPPPLFNAKTFELLRDQSHVLVACRHTPDAVCTLQHPRFAPMQVVPFSLPSLRCSGLVSLIESLDRGIDTEDFEEE